MSPASEFRRNTPVGVERMRSLIRSNTWNVSNMRLAMFTSTVEALLKYRRLLGASFHG